MVTLQSASNIATDGYSVRGEKVFESDATIERDAGRATSLVNLTLMAQKASNLKFVPLTDVDPAVVPGSLACGAIGGTAAEFAALASSSFKIGFDGEAVIEVVCDFSGLDSPADLPGYMTCGAIGATLPQLAAVSDGQFGIAFDGNAAIQVGPCDFSGVDAIDDTPGYWTCAANGSNIAGYVALADAAFSYVIDGVAGDTGAMNLTTCVTFADVVQKINYHLNGEATMLYGWNTDVFKLVSNKTGETSSVTIGAPAAGTDISAAGYLNAAAGAATAGTGGENLGETPTSIINAALAGRGLCYFDGDAFVFISRRAGETSSVSVLTAGTAGTDISGAGFLNGLTGTGTPTAGTGGEGLFESIVDIINAELAGRGECSFDGDKFIFWSNSTNYDSAVSYLTAGATGTDISGAGYLNGLTGTGVITAATIADGENIPVGFYVGDDITAAALVAADVTDLNILVGKSVEIDEDAITLEGSLTLNTIIPSLGMSIRRWLEARGLYIRQTDYYQQYQPLT